MSTVTAAEFDYLDAEYARFLMSDLRDYMALFFSTEERLCAHEYELAGVSDWNPVECKFEPGSVDRAYRTLNWIAQIREGRETAAAVAKWTAAPQPLSHRIGDALAAR